ncbi:MAG: preprotein translocase subunit SecE [Aquificaceae bacterium]
MAMERLKEFLKSTRKELNKVSWPNRELVIKATISVIIFSLFFGISLWAFDLIFTRLVHFLLSLRG